MSKNILDSWPLSSPPRPNQIKALEWLEKQTAKYLILEAPVGCHKKDTPILMFDGTIKVVQNIKIGDLLMGPDSKPRRVLRLLTGVDQMYEIIPIKGEPFIVNQHHILSVTTTKARRHNFDGTTVINISVLDYLNMSNDFKRNVKLYKPKLLHFEITQEPLIIDPYLLGLFLGDGHIKGGQVNLTTADREIKDFVYEKAQEYGLGIREYQNEGNRATTYNFSNRNQRGGSLQTRVKNTLLEHLKQVGVYGCGSGDKFIPHDYKTSSVDSRYAILAGLLDSDGYYQGVFCITTKSARLAEDIKFIARSLGISANSYHRFVGTNKYTEVVLSGDLDKIPTRLSRKQAAPRKQKKRVHVTGFKVVPNTIDTFYGFELNDDHLYLLGDFTVTHNSGKSAIGLTYSLFLGERTNRGDSYILTPQRILQEQYETSFKDISVGLASLYGKANYQCGKGVNCEIGSLLESKDSQCERCPYKLAREYAQSASNTVLNYKLALTTFYYTNLFSRRKLLVLDECHTLESHLVEFDAVTVSESRCKRYNIEFKTFTSLKPALEWADITYRPKIVEAFRKLEDEYLRLQDKIAERGSRSLTNEETKTLKEYVSLKDHLDMLTDFLGEEDSYIDEHFVLTSTPISFQFKRLYGAHSFGKIVDPIAERILFMSSTILDKKGFCSDLGIDPENSAFLSLDSDFPREHRPVYYIPIMKMNFKWKEKENEQSREQMLNSLIQILNGHSDETGLVHTGNFEISKWLVKELSGKIPHRIYHHNPEGTNDRNLAINNFINETAPSILISPSSTEGLDLKEDLGRFAIFVKIPFGNLGDQWIKKRMDLSNEWYQRKALIDIIQGGGRVVRSRDDWGSVYILDGSWGFLYKTACNKVPKWWREAYQII